MSDYVIRATAGGGSVRAFVATMKDTVNQAQMYHKTSAVASAVLGRTLAAASMMGLMLKDDKDLLSISIKGDGPVGGVLATSDSKGRVKGYAFNPDIYLPLKPNGKLDVSGAVGTGFVSVIKDLGLKEPYVGQIPVVSGEIAEDMAYYFTQSEQTPSAVALGVLVDVDFSIKQAGGFILQLLPGAEDAVVQKLEETLENMPSVTMMLEAGKTPEDILNDLLGEFNPEILEKTPVGYHCDCTRERVEKALISLGKTELQKIAEEDKQAELNCHFCDKKYHFTEEALTSLIAMR
jgi:molecular chaperone Hsp33